jgi:protein involved in polysaccharide export with SLBB domain
VNNGRARRFLLPSLISLIFVGANMSACFATISPGDTLYVKVWNHPELSKQVIVDANGGVRVPLSGVVAVSGLDEAAAAQKLTVALRPYVVYPAVDVATIEQGKTLFVSGGPGGVLKYQPGESLQAAVADVMQSSPEPSQNLNANGQSLSKSVGTQSALVSRIDLRNVKVQRNGAPLGTYDTVALTSQGNSGPALLPGDTIVFAYKPIQVRVAGDVSQPGMSYLSSGQSLSEAISQAGGLSPTAASNHVLLQRGSETRSLALGNPIFTEPAQMGDVVTIPAAPRVNVVGTVATPGLVSLRTDPSLLSAMYTAGGPTKTANLKDVQIVHAGTTKTYDVTKLTHGDMDENPALADGDTVVVPEGHKIDWSGIFGILGGIAAGLASRVPI